MAESLNKNARLQIENHFLSMQQERYDNLKTAIDAVRQTRHGMRHRFNRISAPVRKGNPKKLPSTPDTAILRIPDLDLNFCENNAADSVVCYYSTLARREEIPFQALADLPEKLPVDEIGMYLVLSNLLENSLETSRKTAPARRRISIQAYMHSNRILLIQVKNTFNKEITEKIFYPTLDKEPKEKEAAAMPLRHPDNLFLFITVSCDLMVEQTDSRKCHRHTVFIACSDHILVSHRSSRLRNVRNT